MKLLVVDCCIRGEASRTARLLEAALSAVPAGTDVERLTLTGETELLRPLDAAALAERDAILVRGALDHPSLALARQFAAADRILIAAPYWDMSFPALLKIYIERITVSGVTFSSGEQGLTGLCRAKGLLYLTTRGGFLAPDGDDAGASYWRALCGMYGIPHFASVSAQGLDVFQGEESAAALSAACREAEKAGERLMG